MIQTTTLLSWLGLCNVLCLCLLFLGFRRIEAGGLRYTFLAVVATGMLYFNPLILFWIPDQTSEVLLVISRAVFSGVIVLANAFVVFVIRFTQLSGEFRKIRFWVFEFTVVTLLAIVWAGFLPLAVVRREGEIVLEHGLAHALFVSATSLYVAYMGYLAWIGYERTQEEGLRLQIKVVLGTGVLTACTMVLTNSILPFLIHRSVFAPVAAAELVAFWSVALYVLIHRELLLVRRDFAILLRKPFMRDLTTLFGLRTYLYAFETVLELDRPLDERLTLRAEDNREVHLHISNEPATRSRERGAIPEGWQAGNASEIERLRRENARLTLELVRGRNMVLSLAGGVNSLAPREISPAAELPAMTGLTPLEEAERRTIVMTLEKHSFNQARASKELGIGTNTMIVKMRKYGISAPAGIVRAGRPPKPFT